MFGIFILYIGQIGMSKQCRPRSNGSLSADPDQMAPKGVICSGSTLFAILSKYFRHIAN